MRSNPWLVSVVSGRYAESAFSTDTQFMDTTEKISAMPNSRKNRLRLSTIKVAALTINPPSSPPFFGCSSIICPLLFTAKVFLDLLYIIVLCHRFFNNDLRSFYSFNILFRNMHWKERVHIKKATTPGTRHVTHRDDHFLIITI